MEEGRGKRFFGDQYFAALRLEKKNEPQTFAPSRSQETVGVDATVNFPLQPPTITNGKSCCSDGRNCISGDGCNTDSGSQHGKVEAEDKNDGAISYIDDDDDQGSLFPGNRGASPEDLRGKPALFGLENEICKNSSHSMPASRGFRNFALPTNYYSGVSADLDENPLSQHDETVEKLEFAEMHQQQKRVPSPTSYVSPLINTSMNDQVDRSRQLHPQRRLVGTGGGCILPNEELQDDSKNEADKRMTRARKAMMRRKQQREDKSVKRSEDIEGYRGYEEDVDNVVAYIEGTDAVKKPQEDHGKRTKKKSGGSADQGNVTQKKEKAHSPSSVGSETTTPVIVAQEKSTTAPVVAGNKGDEEEEKDQGQNLGNVQGGQFCNVLEPPGDSVIAHRLQMEEFALRSGDLPSSMQSAAVDEKADFITVSNRKQKQVRSYYRDRVFSASKFKRATTPPPASHKMVHTTSSHIERQRRNSYDYSYVSSFSNPAIPPASAKEASVVSSTSTCSVQARVCIGAVPDVTTMVSSVMLDNADSEFNNTSFSSVDGDLAAAVKMSYANAAAATFLSRGNQEPAKFGNGPLGNHEGSGRKESISTTDMAAEPPTQSIPTTPPKERSASSVVDVQSPIEFPALSSALKVEAAQSDVAWGGGTRLEKVTEAVSLPPAKLDVGKRFENMEFVYVSSDKTSNSAEVEAGLPPEAQPSTNQLSAVMTGNGHEVLQMLFASCTNGDASGASKQFVDISTSGLAVNGDGGGPGPAVQFMGMTAPVLDSAYNFSFVFGEGEDDSVIKEVMSRSMSVTAQSTKGISIHASTSSLDVGNGLEMRGNGGSPSSHGVPSALECGAQNKVYDAMLKFAKDAWGNFTRDGNYAYYEPNED